MFSMKKRGPAPALPKFSTGRPSRSASKVGYGRSQKQPNVWAAPTQVKYSPGASDRGAGPRRSPGSVEPEQPRSR